MADNVDARVMRRVEVKQYWLDDWVEEPHLEPVSASWGVMPQGSSARLRYLFGLIKEPDEADFAWRPRLARLDWYVRIVVRHDTTDPPAEDEVLFVGVIIDDATVILSGEEEGTQEFECRGLEYLLETQPIERSYIFSPDGPAAEDWELDWVPTFNQMAPRTRSLLGNRSAEADADGVYRFAAAAEMPEGHIWNHRQIVEYLLAKHGPAGGLGWTLGGQAAELDAITEVVDVSGLSLLAAINQLIQYKRGLGWYLEVPEAVEDPVVLRVFSVADQPIVIGDHTLAANDRLTNFVVPDTFPFTHLVDRLQFRLTSVNKYDRIIVQADRMLCMGTFAVVNGTLEPGWSESEEQAYNEADGLTDEDEADAWRRQPALEHVYRRYRIPRDWDWMVGDGYSASSEKRQLVPWVNDDGTVDLVSVESPPAWLGGKVFARDTLLRVGVDYSVAPPAESEASAVPQFVPLLVYVVDDQLLQFSEQPRTNRWLQVDVAREDLPRASVRPLDDEPGIWVQGSPAHVYAGDPAVPITVTETPPQFAYNRLGCTAVLEADVRPRIVIDLADLIGVTPHESQRTLVYTVSGAEYWHVAPETVIGIDGDGNPLRFDSANNPLRDCREELETAAAILRAWFAVERQAARIPLKRLGRWAELGMLLTSIEAAGWEPVSIHTVVTALHHDFLGAEQGTTIATGYDDLDYMGLVAAAAERPRAKAAARTIQLDAAQAYPLAAIPVRAAESVRFRRAHWWGRIKTGNSWARGSVGSPTSCPIELIAYHSLTNEWLGFGQFEIEAMDFGLIPAGFSPLVAGTMVKLAQHITETGHVVWVYDGADLC